MSKQSDDEQDSCVAERSAVAREIAELQETILRLARDRERLPQPLFWSLFNSRLEDIKRHKESERALKSALGEDLE